MSKVDFLNRSVVAAILREKHKISNEYAMTLSEKMLNDLELPDDICEEILSHSKDLFKESSERLEQFVVDYEGCKFDFRELVIKTVDLATEFSIRSSEKVNGIIHNGIMNGEIDLGVDPEMS